MLLLEKFRPVHSALLFFVSLKYFQGDNTLQFWSNWWFQVLKMFSSPVAEQFVVTYFEFQVWLKLFQWICKCRNEPKLCLYAKESKGKKINKGLSQTYSISSWCHFIWHLFENQNMRAYVLPVPHNTAVLEGEEMNVFLFSYYFCSDSNVSWSALDTDLSRHFCFVPLPPFQFPNLYFALQSVAGRLLLCAQKPQDCGRVTDHTPHTCWCFYEIRSVIFNPSCQKRKMTSCVVIILKSPVAFSVSQKRTVLVCGAKANFKCSCAAVRWSWVGNLTAPKHRSQKSPSDNTGFLL